MTMTAWHGLVSIKLEPGGGGITVVTKLYHTPKMIWVGWGQMGQRSRMSHIIYIHLNSKLIIILKNFQLQSVGH
jgi:hypothetical protein